MPAEPIVPDAQVSQTAASVSAPAPEPVSDVSSQAPSLRDGLKALDYDVSQFQDDDTALKHLVEQAQLNEQMRPYAQLGATVAPQYSAFQQWQAEQQKAQQKPPEPEEPYWPKAPEFNEGWRAQYNEALQNKDFTTVARLGPKIEAHDEFVRGRLMDMVTKGPDAFETYFNRRDQKFIEKVVKQIREESESRERANYEQMMAAHLITKYENEFIETDEQGNRRYTPMGMATMQVLNAMQQMPGFNQSDVTQQMEWARIAAAGLLAQQQAAAPAVPAPTPESHRRDYIRQGMRAVSRNTADSQPDLTPPQALGARAMIEREFEATKKRMGVASE